MIRRIIASILTISPFLHAAEPDQVLRVPNTAQNRFILDKLELEHDCYGKSESTLDFLYDARAKELLSTRNSLRARLLQDATVYIADVEATNLSRTSAADLGQYHTVAEANDLIHSLAKNYPDLVRLRSFAKSHEGRDILVLEIGKNPGNATADFLFTGSHHAREWISTEVALYLARTLVEGYAGNERLQKILDSTRIVVVPILNPDGADYSRTSSRMWRKNRRPVTDRHVGVDNNRNYAYKWGTTGASPSPWSDTFRGPEPMSEVENNVVIALQNEYGFDAAVSFHSYSELVLWPWGYTGKIKARDHLVFEKHGKEMGRILGYKPMQISGLYEASGGFDDMLYAEHRVLAYTIELGKWFIPEENEIQPINESAFSACLYLMENARNPLPANDDPLYLVMGNLQNLVAQMTLSDSEISDSSLMPALALYSDSVLNRAMDGLDMESRLRAQILSELARVRLSLRHQN